MLERGRFFRWSWTRDGEPVGSIGVRVGHDRVALNYRYRHGDEDGQDVTYSVLLDRSPCTYGGTRAWFLCPAQGCGRRIAILYLGGRYFACRPCCHLAYESQNESAAGRTRLKAQRLRMKLGGSANLTKLFPDKPKGMHWRTYERLRAQAEAAEGQSWAMLDDKLRCWRKG